MREKLPSQGKSGPAALSRRRFFSCSAALAATAVSASLAPSELDDASHLAQVLGLRHRLVSTREVDDERYASNPVDRCYFCKTHLYTELEQLIRETGARALARHELSL